MTINVQNPDGTTAPASSQQLATVRADLGVPTTAEVTATVEASAAAVLAQVPTLAAAVVPPVATAEQAAAGTDDSALMTPAKTAAAIAALAPASSSGLPSEVAFAQALPLTGNLRMARHFVSGPLTFTLGANPAAGAQLSLELVADGVNTPTFGTGLFKLEGSQDYSNTIGVVNIVALWCDGTRAYYAVGYSPAATESVPVTPVLPGAPATFTAGAVGTTTQALNWTAPATGYPATYTYSIAYRVNGSGSFPSPQLTGLTGLTTTVTGLSPSTAYDYQITATNTTGTGPAATLLNLSTSASLTVPGAVVGLAAGTPTSSTVALTWSVPSTGGGSITDYVVQYAAAGTSFAIPTTFADGTSATTGATVTGLAESTAYDFRVAAVNAAGTGAYATVLSVVTAAAGGGTTATPITVSASQNIVVEGGEVYSATPDGTSHFAHILVGGSLVGDGWVEANRANATDSSGMVCLDPSNSSGLGTGSCDFAGQCNASGVVLYGTNATTLTSTGYTLPDGAGSRFRVRRVGTVVTLETTVNDGADWTVRHTYATPSSGTLYAHVYTTFSTFARKIYQPRVSGFA